MWSLIPIHYAIAECGLSGSNGQRASAQHENLNGAAPDLLWKLESFDTSHVRLPIEPALSAFLKQHVERKWGNQHYLVLGSWYLVLGSCSSKILLKGVYTGGVLSRLVANFCFSLSLLFAVMFWIHSRLFQLLRILVGCSSLWSFLERMSMHVHLSWPGLFWTVDHVHVWIGLVWEMYRVCGRYQPCHASSYKDR